VRPSLRLLVMAVDGPDGPGWWFSVAKGPVPVATGHARTMAEGFETALAHAQTVVNEEEATCADS